jgi:hypothetical protein
LLAAICGAFGITLDECAEPLAVLRGLGFDVLPKVPGEGCDLSDAADVLGDTHPVTSDWLRKVEASHG